MIVVCLLISFKISFSGRRIGVVAGVRMGFLVLNVGLELLLELVSGIKLKCLPKRQALVLTNRNRRSGSGKMRLRLHLLLAQLIEL